MKNHSQIAVTLFNLRNFCKTESDYVHTLELLKRIGYSVVQVSAVPLEAEIIRKHLDEFGMQCCATHEKFDFLFGDPGEVSAKLDILGCDFTALGCPSEVFFSQVGMQELAAKFNAQGKELAKRGKMLAYHNHAYEFARMGGRQVLLDTFYANTDPEFVKAELDVQWVARGGGDPAAWIRKLAGRIPVIHFKDFTITERNTPTLCEVGEGNLNWEEIVRACREIGVEYYSIEQDQEFPGRSIFDSMRISFDNMKKFGFA